MVWTAQSVERARRLVNLPTLGTAFVGTVMTAFADVVPQSDTHTMAFEGDWTGSAWAALAASPDRKISYVLCVSGFYPIATLRACATLDPGDGLNEHWPEPPIGSAPYLDQLMSRFGPLCSEVGYLFAHPMSAAIQQTIRFGWIGSCQAWDYLFYLGVPTG